MTGGVGQVLVTNFSGTNRNGSTRDRPANCQAKQEN